MSQRGNVTGASLKATIVSNLTAITNRDAANAFSHVVKNPCLTGEASTQCPIITRLAGLKRRTGTAVKNCRHSFRKKLLALFPSS
jgi:hypothetical protein